jgi:hypothetical protein
LLGIEERLLDRIALGIEVDGDELDGAARHGIRHRQLAARGAAEPAHVDCVFMPIHRRGLMLRLP